MVTTNKENAIFLRKIEPYREGSVLYASENHLLAVTGLPRQTFLSLLTQNGLTIDEGQRWRRKIITPKTQDKISYAKRRLQECPDISFATLGKEMGCSKQYVKQLFSRYGIKK